MKAQLHKELHGEQSQSLFQQMVFCNMGTCIRQPFQKKSQSLFQQMVFCNLIKTDNQKKNGKSQSLFQQMVFCNRIVPSDLFKILRSQSLFQQMVFCNMVWMMQSLQMHQSQSLFQQMVFCNEMISRGFDHIIGGHNPYFSRWFSAIRIKPYASNCMGNVTILILVDGFLQFQYMKDEYIEKESHNPYFSRWFSAIFFAYKSAQEIIMSQSLFQQMVFCNQTRC